MPRRSPVWTLCCTADPDAVSFQDQSAEKAEHLKTVLHISICKKLEFRQKIQ